MKNILLIIDDQPERYDYLADLLKDNNLPLSIVILSDPVSVDILLRSNSIMLIMLDCDIPYLNTDREVDFSCNGESYAKMIIDTFGDSAPPIIISSANNAGAKALSMMLSGAGLKMKIMSCRDIFPEERWIGEIALEYIRLITK